MAVAGVGGCWLVKSNADLDGPPLDSGGGGSDGAPDGGVADVGVEDVHFEAGCDVGNILCEDFEHGLAAYWMPDLSPTMPTTSSVTVETTMPAHGTHSLHAVAAAADVNANGPPIAMLRINQGTLPMPFYVRFFVYAKSGGMLELQPSDSAVVTLYEQDAFMDLVEVRATGPAMAKKLALANTGDNTLAASMMAFPLDAWHCLEWAISATSMSLWVDGTPLADLTVMSTLKPIIGQEFGWATDALMSFTSTVGQEVWIDEIIMSTQRIGCTTFQE
jgi:hypothetical protein